MCKTALEGLGTTAEHESERKKIKERERVAAVQSFTVPYTEYNIVAQSGPLPGTRRQARASKENVASYCCIESDTHKPRHLPTRPQNRECLALRTHDKTVVNPL